MWRPTTAPGTAVVATIAGRLAAGADQGHDGVGTPLGKGAHLTGSTIAATVVVEQLVGAAIEVGQKHGAIDRGELDVDVGHAVSSGPVGDATVGTLAGEGLIGIVGRVGKIAGDPFSTVFREQVGRAFAGPLHEAKVGLPGGGLLGSSCDG